MSDLVDENDQNQLPNHILEKKTIHSDSTIHVNSTLHQLKDYIKLF